MKVEKSVVKEMLLEDLEVIKWEISFITIIIATIAIIDKATATTQEGKIAHKVINIACKVYII